MTDLAGDVGLVRTRSGVDAGDELPGVSLRYAGVRCVRSGTGAGRSERTAGGVRVSGAVRGTSAAQHDAGDDRVYVYRQRIAGCALSTGRDIRDSRLVGGIAYGVVGNTTAGVPVPCAAT